MKKKQTHSVTQQSYYQRETHTYNQTQRDTDTQTHIHIERYKDTLVETLHFTLSTLCLCITQKGWIRKLCYQTSK